MRALLLAVLVGLALLPGAARAADQPLRPTPIEVAAQVVACMDYARTYNGEQAIEARGGVYSAALFEYGELVATLHRGADDPAVPPLALDFQPGFVDASLMNRETARYTLNCFNQVYH